MALLHLANRVLPRRQAKSPRRRAGFQMPAFARLALRITDADGRGCVASLIITDSQGRIYPPQMMRIAPDLEFQRQIYRADGETVRLPDGEYTIESKRGPEYLPNIQTIKSPAARAMRMSR